MMSVAGRPLHSRHREHGFTLLVGLVAGLWLLWRLGRGSLTPWDEAFYAEIGREMLRSGDWLTPRFNFEPCLEKPPLLMWCNALLFSIFGVTEFWARVTSAAAGVAVVVLVYLIGKHVYNRTAGLLAGAVMLTNYQFVNNARWGTTDILLTLLITLCIYAYLVLLPHSAKWWYLIGIAFALAILTKGPPALVAPAVIALDLIAGRCVAATLRSRHFWAAIIVAAVVVVPWFLSMAALHPQLFYERVYFNVILRNLRPVEQHIGGPGYYLEALRRYFFPWAYLLPFALALAVWDNRTRQTGSRALLILVAVVFGAFTLVASKIEWYILPMHPALAIFIGHLLNRAGESPRSFSFVGLAVATGVAALFVSHKLEILLGGAIAILLIGSVLRKQVLHRQIVAVLAVFCMAAGATRLRSLYHKPVWAASRLAQLAASKGEQDRKPLLIVETHGLRQTTVLFYSHRPVRIAESVEQVPGLVNGEEPTRLLLNTNEIPRLSATCDVHELARDDEFAYLLVTSQSRQPAN